MEVLRKHARLSTADIEGFSFLNISKKDIARETHLSTELIRRALKGEQIRQKSYERLVCFLAKHSLFGRDK